MKQIGKQIGSLFLSVCMVVTMLPVMAFANTQELDADTELITSSRITAFADLDEDIATQKVEIGTTEDELNLPDKLAVTVTKMVTVNTDSDITATVNENDSNIGSQEQELEDQEEVQTETQEIQEIQEQTTVPVYSWVADQEYDSETTGNYVFTPTLDLPEGLTLTQGISVPTVTVTVAEDDPLSLFSFKGIKDDDTLPTVTPATTEDLENALKSGIPSNIVINDELYIENEVIVGANHMLSIASSGMINIGGNGRLTIPSGRELTANGGGGISCDNSVTQALRVAGDLILNGIAFIIISEDNYIVGSLHATDCNIYIENKSGLGIVINTGAELEIQGGSLHINSKESYWCGILSNSNNLMIKECDVMIASSGNDLGNSASGIAGDVIFEESTITFEIDGWGTGIFFNFLTFDNCDVSLKNKGVRTVLVSGFSGLESELKLLNGTIVTAECQGDGAGIEMRPSFPESKATLSIDNSTLVLKADSSVHQLILNEKTILTGNNNGKIVFEEGCNVSGLKNKIKDRGIIIDTDEQIVVGESTDEPNPNKISAGTYTWDGAYFSKYYDITFAAQQIGGESTKTDSTGIELTFSQDVTGLTWDKIKVKNSDGEVSYGTLSGLGDTWMIELLSVEKEGIVEVSVEDFDLYHVTTDDQEVMVYKNMMTSGISGTMVIGGEVGKNLANDQSGTGWTWDRETATLTLTSDYVSSNGIWIVCQPTDTIHLVYSGDVTISASDCALSCEGALSISGNGTLTLEITSSSIEALRVANGNLNILSGKIIATGRIGIITYAGDIIIHNGANVTATSIGETGRRVGIQASKEYGIFINGATISASTMGDGQYDAALLAGNININGGVVNLFSAFDMQYVIAQDNILNITGGATVKIDDTQVYLTTLTLDGVNQKTYVTEVIKPTSIYGRASRYTTEDGKLFFLLPAGNQTVTLKVDDDTYTNNKVNVTTDHEASALLSKQSKIYAVTVNGSYAATTGAGSYVQGEKVTIDAGSRNNYSFDGWRANGVTLTNSTKAVTTFTMPANHVTITAIWRLKDGTSGSEGGSGSGGYSGSSSSNPISAKSTVPDQTFGMGDIESIPNFIDITNHWAKQSIDYVVGIGLLNGITKNTFEPNSAMTRGMLMTALGRLAKVDTKVYTTSSFTDVKVNSDFSPYIEWAYEKGIVRGTGSGKFEPNRAITREEIAVIFVNFANATGYTLPKIHSESAYADAPNIGSTYQAAVTAMQQAGIMRGSSGNKFNPKSSATRGELSTMLHRYIMLTMESDATQF